MWQFAIGAVLGLLATGAQAAVISGADITPSTSLTALGAFPVTALVDGITQEAAPTTAPYNGFVSRVTSGTVRLDLSGPFTLTDFVLFNDVNLRTEGVRNFQLSFFNGGGSPFATSAVFTAATGIAAGQVFSFGSLPSVTRVDLNILSTWDSNGIEIRELRFLGDSAAIPVPALGLAFAAAALALRARR